MDTNHKENIFKRTALGRESISNYLTNLQQNTNTNTNSMKTNYGARKNVPGSYLKRARSSLRRRAVKSSLAM